MVQKCDNLVDLEKCCKRSIHLQRLVPIPRRTSRLKFDDLADKSEKSSISNISTKPAAAEAKITEHQEASCFVQDEGQS